MRPLLVLSLLLVTIVMQAQIDTINVFQRFFYSEPPATWQLVSKSDSVCFTYGTNIIYKHPVRTENTFARINISFNPLEERKFDVDVQTGKTKVNYDYSSKIINGFPCQFFNREIPMKKGKYLRTTATYLYRLNDRYELRFVLDCVALTFESAGLLDTLEKTVRFFFEKNAEAIRQLEAPAISVIKTDSAWYNQNCFYFPVPDQWMMNWNMGSRNDSKKDLEERKIYLTALPNSRNYNGSITISPSFKPDTILQKELGAASESQTDYVISPQTWPPVPELIPFYADNRIQSQNYFIFHAELLYNGLASPAGSLLMKNNYYIVLLKHGQPDLVITISMSGSFNSVMELARLDKFMLDYVQQVEAMNNFGSWKN